MQTLAALVKHIHVWLVVLSLAGFVIRFFGSQKNASFLHNKTVRIAPHIIDTFLLLSGISLIVLYGWSPIAHHWLTAKLVLVVVYIVLGYLAMRGPFSRKGRQLSGAAALATAFCIIFLAVYKPPLV